MNPDFSTETEALDTARSRKREETLNWVAQLKTPWLRDELIEAIHAERMPVADAPENHDAAKSLIDEFDLDDAVAFIDEARKRAAEEFERRPSLGRVSVPISKSDADGSNVRRVAVLVFSREGGK